VKPGNYNRETVRRDDRGSCILNSRDHWHSRTWNSLAVECSYIYTQPKVCFHTVRVFLHLHTTKGMLSYCQRVLTSAHNQRYAFILSECSYIYTQLKACFHAVRAFSHVRTTDALTTRRTGPCLLETVTLQPKRRFPVSRTDDTPNRVMFVSNSDTPA